MKFDRIRGSKLALCTGVMAAISAASNANAANIPGVTSVQDLINLNIGSPTDGVVQGGVVLSGIRYYDFAYPSPTPGSPSATQVLVETSPGPVGQTGLEFSFEWLAAAGSSMKSTIRYKAHIEAPNPSLIDRVQAFFDGDVPDGFASPATFAQVSETVKTLDGTLLGTIGLFDDDTGAGVDTKVGILNLTPALADIELSKTIRVNSSVAGLATISIVDNTFRQSAVPEPTGALVAAVGVFGLAARRRRQKTA